jgi:hypothetical protein
MPRRAESNRAASTGQALASCRAVRAFPLYSAPTPSSSRIIVSTVSSSSAVSDGGNRSPHRANISGAPKTDGTRAHALTSAMTSSVRTRPRTVPDGLHA